MEQSKTLTKLLQILRFRKHIKELTNACKRINKEKRYEFGPTKPPETVSLHTKTGKSFHLLAVEKRTKENSSHLSTQMECLTVHNHDQPLENMTNYEHLSLATPTSPANLSMIISQSYKPLHAKSTQFNRNTIAVTKDAIVKALYTKSNWVFIEIPETSETGFIPIYCLRSIESSPPLFESPSQNNISLLNVSIYEKPRHPRRSIADNQSYHISKPASGGFISSIGPCRLNNESHISTYPRLSKAATYTRQQIIDGSVLSREISNISLHADDQDAYTTLNLTPCQSLSMSVLDPQPIIFRTNHRLRVLENYQRQFVGDISVIESEVVVPVNTTESIGNWKLVRRGDGKQGYIPEHIVVLDQHFA